ncbi:MAG: hypothetical protein J6Y24_03780 [Bacteroidales bacterium]|nr:hypothetical protein [Bacteroidales bacterium]
MEKFSLDRFKKILKFELANARKKYIFGIIFIFSIELLAIALHIYFHYPILKDATAFVICVPIALATNVTGFNGDKKKIINALMMPASVTEKFWARFIVYWLIPMLFVFGIFWILPHSLGSHFVLENGEWVEPTTVELLWREHRFFFCSTWCLTGLLILGGILFKKDAFQKTLALVVSIFILFFLFMSFFGDKLFPKTIVDVNGNVIQQGFTIHYVTMFQLILSFSVVSVCTTIAYYKFKRLTLKS